MAWVERGKGCGRVIEAEGQCHRGREDGILGEGALTQLRLEGRRVACQGAAVPGEEQHVWGLGAVCVKARTPGAPHRVKECSTASLSQTPALRG